MSGEISANCQCGAVSFTSKQAPIIQLSCHCTDCRAATGNDFSNIAFFKAKSIEITGDLKPRYFTAASNNQTQRDSCTTCGTVMFDKSAGFPGLIGVFIEQIQSPFSANIQCHVWIKSKLDSTQLPTSIPCYDEGIPK